MKENFELRVLDSNLSIDEDEMIVEGLVNETNAWSHQLGQRKKFVEKIEKGAFQKAIEENPRIDFLSEHRDDMLLATTENGSLQLWEDEKGLKMRAKIAPTSYGKDIFTLMKNNMINHMSFGFKVLSDKWDKRSDGIYCRSVNKLALKEVSVVRNPAYPQSVIAARGIDVVEDVEIPAELEERNEQNIEEPKNVESNPVVIEPVVEQPKLTNNTITKEDVQSMFNSFESKIMDMLKPQVEQPVVEQPKTEEKPIVVEQPQVEQPKVEGQLKTEVVVKPTQLAQPQEENRPVDNSKQIIDLLNKYKDLQSLKN